MKKDEVWVSSVHSYYQIFMKLGIRQKYYGEDWQPPTHIIPPNNPRTHNASRRHWKGFRLEREDFSEASYVFDEKRFNKTGDLIMAGPFLVVSGQLAEILEQADLGAGGLIPYPIYQKDKTTRLETEYFLLNFDGPKDTLLPTKSKNIRLIYKGDEKRNISDFWGDWGNLEDDDLAVKCAALDGADIWIDSAFSDRIFMKGRLAHAIMDAKIKPNLYLTRCRVLTGEEAD